MLLLLRGRICLSCLHATYTPIAVNARLIIATTIPINSDLLNECPPVELGSEGVGAGDLEKGEEAEKEVFAELVVGNQEVVKGGVV